MQIGRSSSRVEQLVCDVCSNTDNTEGINKIDWVFTCSGYMFRCTLRLQVSLHFSTLVHCTFKVSHTKQVIFLKIYLTPMHDNIVITEYEYITLALPRCLILKLYTIRSRVANCMRALPITSHIRYSWGHKSVRGKTQKW